MTTLPRDFKEFIELLNRNSVRYLIIGGYAVVYHGYVRSTNDIDIWIDIQKDNIKKLISVLDEFGFSSPGIKASDFLPNQIIQLGYPPNRIDLMTTPAGIDFGTCYPTREQVDIDGITVNIIDLDNLNETPRRKQRGIHLKFSQRPKGRGIKPSSALGGLKPKRQATGQET